MCTGLVVGTISVIEIHFCQHPRIFRIIWKKNLKNDTSMFTLLFLISVKHILQARFTPCSHDHGKKSSRRLKSLITDLDSSKISNKFFHTQNSPMKNSY